MISPLRLVLATILCSAMYVTTSAQSVAINTDGSTANSSAILDVKSTAKGMLIPRMSKTEKNAIASPATGLLVFQNTPDSIGFHYYDGSKWIFLAVGDADSTSWKINGNGNIRSSNFLGTTNDSALRFRVKNIASGMLDSINTAFGFRSLSNLTAAGISNTAYGYNAARFNTTGFNNVAIGHRALSANDTSKNNTAIGWLAAYYNNKDNNVAIGSQAGTYWGLPGYVGGTENTAVGTDAGTGIFTMPKTTAIGYRALYSRVGSTIYSNSTGRNTAIGDSALAFGGYGYSNVAVGTNAMGIGFDASLNVAVGDSAMGAAVSAVGQVAVGYRSLTRTSASYPNTAVGYYSQDSATTGGANTSIGSYALGKNKQGYNNTAIGNAAMFESVNTQSTNYLFDNTAVGNDALRFTRYYGQTAVGASALHSDTSGLYNTAIGYVAMNLHLRGNSNTAVGTSALRYDTSGGGNTAIGVNSMISHKNGDLNTAVGLEALGNDINGGANTAIGTYAMHEHKTNGVNTAVGFEAMYYDTASSYSAAYGFRALRYTKNGYENTALGVGTIEFSDSSYYNTAVGRGAMFQKGGTYNTTVGYFAAGEGVGVPTTKNYTIGTTNVGALAGYRSKADENTFVGYYSGAGIGTDTLKGIENTGLGSYTLTYTTTGKSNTAVGMGPLYFNSTGSGNVAVGTRALLNNSTGSGNIAIGDSAMYNNGTGSGNTAIGNFANVSISNWTNATAIGNRAYVAASNSMVLGSISGVNSATASTNIGIGVSVPLARLHVRRNGVSGGALIANASMIVEDNTSSYIHLSNPTAAENGILSGNAATTIRSGIVFGADSTVFLRSGGNNTRMIIDNNGYVGVGTTATYPLTQFHLYEPLSTNVNLRVASANLGFEPGLELVKTAAAGSDWKLRVTTGGALVYSRGTDDFATAPVDYYQMTTAGILPVTDISYSLGGPSNRWTTVYAQAGTINTSDVRDKENISNLSYGLNEIMKLRPVTFSWKENPQWGKKIGFIAQEVQPILNEVVQVGELKSKTVLKDDNGKLVNKDTDKLGIYYSDIIPVTVKAIQEQQALIDKQAKEVEELKKKNEKLEKDIQLIKAKLGL